ncbi:hypothetical protein TNCV_3673851 [Trichonephila clavipes]|nr:hypothetical protein TNCV_3673851 [Trichonephila clavipes]
MDVVLKKTNHKIQDIQTCLISIVVELKRCCIEARLLLNLTQREPLLPQLKRFRQKRKISCRQKPCSRTVTNNDSTECRSVCTEGNYFEGFKRAIINGARDYEPWSRDEDNNRDSYTPFQLVDFEQ